MIFAGRLWSDPEDIAHDRVSERLDIGVYNQIEDFFDAMPGVASGIIRAIHKAAKTKPEGGDTP